MLPILWKIFFFNHPPLAIVHSTFAFNIHLPFCEDPNPPSSAPFSLLPPDYLIRLCERNSSTQYVACVYHQNLPYFTPSVLTLVFEVSFAIWHQPYFELEIHSTKCWPCLIDGAQQFSNIKVKPRLVPCTKKMSKWSNVTHAKEKTENNSARARQGITIGWSILTLKATAPHQKANVSM